MARFNPAFDRVFEPGRLTLGLMTPFGGMPGAMADLDDTTRLARLADDLGFAALWTRDVPLMVPQGPDLTATALDDPFLWLLLLAGATRRITLGAAAIVLPLRHPLHVAKAALSLDRMSRGRFILGAGSGDRPAEFASFGADLDARAETFRQHWMRLRPALSSDPDVRQALLDHTGGHDLLAAPDADIPMLVVGSARQSLQWTASNADGWATYHREEARQEGRIQLWRQALAQKVAGQAKPFVQSVQLDLLDDPAAPASPLDLGLRTGRQALLAYLRHMHDLGVAHVLFNLSRGSRPMDTVIRELGEHVLPAL